MGVEELTGLNLDNIRLGTHPTHISPLLFPLYLRGLRRLFFIWFHLPPNVQSSEL